MNSKFLILATLLIICSMIADAQYYGYGYSGYGYPSYSSYYGGYGGYGSYGGYYGYPSSYGYGYYGKRSAGFGPSQQQQAN